MKIKYLFVLSMVTVCAALGGVVFLADSPHMKITPVEKQPLTDPIPPEAGQPPGVSEKMDESQKNVISKTLPEDLQEKFRQSALTSTAETFEYPIQPGTDEWNRLFDALDKIAVSQIPPAIIAQMTTTQLLEACYRYPLIGDIFAFNSIEAGFYEYLSNCTAAQDLLKRKDLAAIVARIYRNIDIQKISHADYGPETAVTETEFFRLLFLELLMGHETVYKKIHSDTELHRAILQNMEYKLNHTEVFGFCDIDSSLFILSRAWKTHNVKTDSVLTGPHVETSKIVDDSAHNDRCKKFIEIGYQLIAKMEGKIKLNN